MKRKAVSVVLCLAILATVASGVALAAQGQGSGVTILPPVKVTGPDGQGNYTFTATGAMTLAAGDTLVNYRFFFSDPNGNQVAPFFQPPFNPPASGNSSNYSCVASSNAKGTWTFTAQMNWTSGGQQKGMTVSSNFNVPASP